MSEAYPLTARSRINLVSVYFMAFLSRQQVDILLYIVVLWEDYKTNFHFICLEYWMENNMKI